MKSHHIIKPIPLQFLLQIYSKGGTVCGGFPRWLASLNTNKTNGCSDIDVYSDSESSYTELEVLLNNMAADKHQSSYNGINSWRYRIKNTDPIIKEDYININLIELFGKPENIINTFDFTVCQAYLDIYSKRVITPDYWRMHDNAYELRLTKNEQAYLPYRMFKYINKGYIPTWETIMTFLSKMKYEQEGDVFETCKWLWDIESILRTQHEDKLSEMCKTMIGLINPTRKKASFEIGL